MILIGKVRSKRAVNREKMSKGGKDKLGKVKSKRVINRGERPKGGGDKLGKVESKRAFRRKKPKGGKKTNIITWSIIIIGFIILIIILCFILSYFMG